MSKKKSSNNKAYSGVRMPDLYKNANDIVGSLFDSNQWNQIQNDAYTARDANYKASRNRFSFSPTKLNFTPVKDTTNDMGMSRYDQGILYNADAEDIANQRGDKQSGLEQLGSGIAKFGVQTATSFIDGTLGLLYGSYKAIEEGRLSALWDNEISNTMRKWNEESEKIFRNYRTQEELNSPWYENLLTANFLGDNLIKNLGFTMGAFLSGNALSATIRGAGKLASLAAFKYLRDAGNLAKAAKAIRTGQNLTANATGVLGAVTSAVNEGRMEANMNAEDWMKLHKQQIDDEFFARKQEIFNKYGDTELGRQKLADEERNYKQSIIELQENKLNMGNVDMLLNIPLLTAGNAFQFFNLYKRGFKAAKAARKAQLATEAKVKGTIGNYTADMTKLKAWGKPIAKAASEGFEELNQQVIANAAGHYYGDYALENYRNAIHDPKAIEQQRNALNVGMKSLAEVYGDPDQWEQFFVGAMTGAMGMPSLKRYTNKAGKTRLGLQMNGGLFEIKDNLEARRNQMSMAENLNKRFNSKEFKDHYDHLTRSFKFSNDQDDAVDADSEINFKDAEDNALINDIDLWRRGGKLNDFREFINDSFEDTSPENIAKIKAMNSEFTSAEDAKKNRIDELNKIISDASKRNTQIEEEITSANDEYLKNTKKYKGKRVPKKAKEDAANAALEKLNSLNEEKSNLTTAVSEANSELEEINNGTKTFKDLYISTYSDNEGNELTDEEVIDKLSKTKKYYNDAIDDYSNSLDMTRNMANPETTPEQITELAWMSTKDKLWKRRIDEMGEEVRPIFSNLLNYFISQKDLLDLIDSKLDTTEGITEEDKNKDKERKEKTRTNLENAINSLTEFLKNDGSVVDESSRRKTLGELLGTNDKELVDYIDALAEQIQRKNPVTETYDFSEEERNKIAKNIKDIRTLQNARLDFTKKFNDWIKNPKKHQESIDRTDRTREDKKRVKELKTFKDKIPFDKHKGEIALFLKNNKKLLDELGGIEKLKEICSKEERNKIIAAVAWNNAFSQYIKILNNQKISTTSKEIIQRFAEDLFTKVDDIAELNNRLKDLVNNNAKLITDEIVEQLYSDKKIENLTEDEFKEVNKVITEINKVIDPTNKDFNIIGPKEDVPTLSIEDTTKKLKKKIEELLKDLKTHTEISEDHKNEIEKELNKFLSNVEEKTEKEVFDIEQQIEDKYNELLSLYNNKKSTSSVEILDTLKNFADKLITHYANNTEITAQQLDAIKNILDKKLKSVNLTESSYENSVATDFINRFRKEATDEITKLLNFERGVEVTQNDLDQILDQVIEHLKDELKDNLDALDPISKFIKDLINEKIKPGFYTEEELKNAIIEINKIVDKTIQEYKNKQNADRPTTTKDLENQSEGKQNVENQRPTDPYDNRPWIIQYNLNSKLGGKYYLDLSDSNPLKARLKMLDSVLERFGSYDYVNLKLATGQDIYIKRFSKEDAERYGEPKLEGEIGIFTLNPKGEEQLLNFLPNAEDLKNAKKEHPSMKKIVDYLNTAGNENKVLHSNVANMYSGDVLFATVESSVAVLFNSKPIRTAPIICKVDEAHNLVDSNGNIHFVDVSKANFITGQVYVLVPSVRDRFLPVLCRSARLDENMDLRNEVNSVLEKYFNPNKDFIDTENLTKELKKLLNIPGLSITCYNKNRKPATKFKSIVRVVIKSNYGTTDINYIGNYGWSRNETLALMKGAFKGVTASNNLFNEKYLITNIKMPKTDPVTGIKLSPHTVNNWFTYTNPKEFGGKADVEAPIDSKTKEKEDPTLRPEIKNEDKISDSSKKADSTNTSEKPNPTPKRIGGVRGRGRRVKLLDKSATTDKTAEVDLNEIKEVKEILPQLSSVDRIVIKKGLSVIGEDGRAREVYGMFKDGVLYINSNSPKGTVYHEAFHYVTSTLFTSEERSKLFTIARDKYNTEDPIELEELLAEDFRHYMNGMTNGFTGFIKRMFEKLKHLIRVVTNNTNSIDEAFYQTYSGKFSQISENENSIAEYKNDLFKYYDNKYTFVNLSEEVQHNLRLQGFTEESFNSMPVRYREKSLKCT